MLRSLATPIGTSTSHRETTHAGDKCAWPGWIPLVALPAIVSAFRGRLAPWAFMWLLAIAIFLGCKWATWFRARTDGVRATPARNVAYLFLWPGMDAAAFLGAERSVVRPRASAWLVAAAKTVAGCALIWLVAHKRPGANTLLDGWIGMLGLVLVLHFGLFHLIALAWQTVGVNAQPIMRSPILSTSLSDFWGRRWNLGFRQLTHGLVFQPVRRRFGSASALLASFLVSGVIHDFVISFPARGGYGLPTGYFVLQGIGVLVERSKAGARLGIDRGFRGWLFTLVCAGAPAYWLFHPLFIRRVILPFFGWLGSL